MAELFLEHEAHRNDTVKPSQQQQHHGNFNTVCALPLVSANDKKLGVFFV